MIFFIQYLQEKARLNTVESNIDSFSADSNLHSRNLCSDLALDEGHCLRAVLVDVLLMRVSIVSGAAVRVSRVAVGLENGNIGGRAAEASRTSSELYRSVSIEFMSMLGVKLTP